MSTQQNKLEEALLQLATDLDLAATNLRMNITGSGQRTTTAPPRREFDLAKIKAEETPRPERDDKEPFWKVIAEANIGNLDYDKLLQALKDARAQGKRGLAAQGMWIWLYDNQTTVGWQRLTKGKKP